MKTSTNNPAPSLQALSDKLDELHRLTAIGVKSTIDLSEAAIYTGFTIGHLYQLTSRREIPHFKVGRKLYFSKAELDEWLQAHPVPTNAEVESRAATYTALNPMQR